MTQSAILTSTSRSRPFLAALAIVTLFMLYILGSGKTDAGDHIQKFLTSSTQVIQSVDTLSSINKQKARSTKDVLLYVYYETEDAKVNFEFFLKHGLHDKIDFVFIVNGDESTVDIPIADNIKVIQRPNTCFDLGAFGEVLQMDNSALIRRYERFILMNASIRGPFLPGWTRTLKTCWSDIFYSYLSDTTKLAGITANCDENYLKHIQSMILALDRTGIELILPNLQCAPSLQDAVDFGEIKLTMSVREAGFDAEPLYSQRYARDYDSSDSFWEQCSHDDVFYANNNDGMDVHPYDTIFVKSVRHVSDRSAYSYAGQVVLDKLTAYAENSKYSSYDYC